MHSVGGELSYATLAPIINDIRMSSPTVAASRGAATTAVVSSGPPGWLVALGIGAVVGAVAIAVWLWNDSSRDGRADPEWTPNRRPPASPMGQDPLRPTGAPKHA